MLAPPLPLPPQSLEEEPGGSEWRGDEREDEELRQSRAGGQAAVLRKSLLSTLHEFTRAILSQQNTWREVQLLSSVSRGEAEEGEVHHFPQVPPGVCTPHSFARLPIVPRQP